MHYKLACLIFCTTGSATFPLAAGHLDSASAGHAVAHALAEHAMADEPPRWESLFHSLEMPGAAEDRGLTDQERLVLREQIRAATRDLYPDIHPHLRPVSSRLTERTVGPLP